jgi:hypothetical protein
VIPPDLDIVEGPVQRPDCPLLVWRSVLFDNKAFRGISITLDRDVPATLVEGPRRKQDLHKVADRIVAHVDAVGRLIVEEGTGGDLGERGDVL